MISEIVVISNAFPHCQKAALFAVSMQCASSTLITYSSSRRASACTTSAPSPPPTAQLGAWRAHSAARAVTRCISARAHWQHPVRRHAEKHVKLATTSAGSPCFDEAPEVATNAREAKFPTLDASPQWPVRERWTITSTLIVCVRRGHQRRRLLSVGRRTPC